MEASLKVLSQAEGRKVAILGNMFELGANEKQLHRQVGNVAAGLDIDEIICIGHLAKEIAEAAKSGKAKVTYFDEKADFENKLFEYVKNGDTVLIKASNGMKFNTIVNSLK